MFVGSLKKINLSTSLFERLITRGQFYVDKTRFIEHFLDEASDVQLITRQRRLGKSLNMDTLRCFLTDQVDNRHLFKGLYIEKSHVWREANSTPVFMFDFKKLTADGYISQLVEMVDKHICSLTDPAQLNDRLRRSYESLVVKLANPTKSLYMLTELVYDLTGKNSYILIDEYDKLLIDNHASAKYEEIRDFIGALFSTAFKDNPYLEKALLTGVMRISKESIFSNLNNISVFDVFSDDTYISDYGFTEEDVNYVGQHTPFCLDDVRKWYNGIRVSGVPIYNTFSFSSYLRKKQLECFWGMSGSMEIIKKLLTDSRRKVITGLLNGEEVSVPFSIRISLHDLQEEAADEVFFSLIAQTGYVSIADTVSSVDGYAKIFIPNTELMIVWRRFIMTSLYPRPTKLVTLFDNAENLELFKSDLEYFLGDRLSYHDLAVQPQDTKRHTEERVYHVFVLGMLSAYKDANCIFPVSNWESGDGRYDILVEKPQANFIFELKVCDNQEDLNKTANTALDQIDEKRYGAELDKSKRLVKIGIAFFGKQCSVQVSEGG